MDNGSGPVLAHTRSFKPSLFRYSWRLLLSLCLLVGAAGLIAPFINASAFGGRIQSALEASLGRKVSFGEVRFSLFSGPGFSLTDVVINEDPRYGLEPFAFVPTLTARVRVAALWRGQLAFSSLRLEDPSLNIVKREDGGWNVFELVGRLAAPRRLPMDLFPAVAVSGARLDFKLGARKTTFYVTDTDLSVYPERSGKLYIQFSGSPARTDRAGNGFGHIRGTANWYRKPVSPDANQLEMDLRLDPSNLSEWTTLLEGHDVGVHGIVSSHARIEGPENALRLTGDLRLGDVRRWDLLPFTSKDWQIGYGGVIDLAHSTLTLKTVSVSRGAPPPVALELRVSRFSSNPTWSMIASLSGAPAAEILPLSRRMGVPIPEGLKLDGAVDGVVSFSKEAGFSGVVELKQVSAELPNLPVLRAASLVADIGPERIRFEPSQIETAASGTIQVGGEYDTASHAVAITLEPAKFPVDAIRGTISAWFGSPAALDLLDTGRITGRIDFHHSEGVDPAWSGQLSFSDAELHPTGIDQPLTAAGGLIRFDRDSVDVEKFSGSLGVIGLTGSYHSSSAPHGPERVRIAVPAADLRDFETVLQPAFQSSGILARLGVTRREIPGWLAGRHLQAELAVDQFSVNGTPLGSLKTRLLWNGPRIDIPALDLKLADGSVHAAGTLDVVTRAPRYQFSASVAGYHWHGGMLAADGTFRTSGTGLDALENLHAEGTFSGHDVSVSADDLFDMVSGAFEFSFADDWPKLRISRLEASQGDEAWTGNAASQSDGKLVIDLEHEGRQRRVISGLEPQSPPISSALSGSGESR